MLLAFKYSICPKNSMTDSLPTATMRDEAQLSLYSGRIKIDSDVLVALTFSRHKTTMTYVLYKDLIHKFKQLDVNLHSLRSDQVWQ